MYKELNLLKLCSLCQLLLGVISFEKQCKPFNNNNIKQQ